MRTSLNSRIKEELDRRKEKSNKKFREFRITTEKSPTSHLNSTIRSPSNHISPYGINKFKQTESFLKEEIAKRGNNFIYNFKYKGTSQGASQGNTTIQKTEKNMSSQRSNTSASDSIFRTSTEATENLRHKIRNFLDPRVGFSTEKILLNIERDIKERRMNQYRNIKNDYDMPEGGDVELEEEAADRKSVV